MLRMCLLFCFVTGFSANDCDQKAKIKQHLLNEGFHRSKPASNPEEFSERANALIEDSDNDGTKDANSLSTPKSESTVSLEECFHEEIADTIEDSDTEGARFDPTSFITQKNITFSIEFDNSLNKDMNENCIVGLDQQLPRGVFANPDELGDFRRLQKLQATPKNRVNIELPAEESHPTGVFIFTELTEGMASAWLPVHARYHHAALGGGFVNNEIPAPFLYLRCSDKKLEQCSQLTTINFYCNADSKEICSWRHIPVTLVTETLNFEVPIGNTAHYYIVSVMTAGAVIAGSLFFLMTLHEYKIKEKAL